jgi:micrococcal nuclease
MKIPYLVVISAVSCLGALNVYAQRHDDLIHFSKRQEEALVVKVNDSDSVILEDGRKIHLIGIESMGPVERKYAERDKNGMIIEEKEEVSIPMEEQALMFAQNLLEGKKIRLEYDVDALDQENRRQAYIFLPDGAMANTELLRQGFVELKIRPPNIKYAEALRTAYREAKREQRGFLAN